MVKLTRTTTSIWGPAVMHCPALVMVTKVVTHRLSEDIHRWRNCQPPDPPPLQLSLLLSLLWYHQSLPRPLMWAPINVLRLARVTSNAGNAAWKNQFHCKVSCISSVTSIQYGTCKLLMIGQVNQTCIKSNYRVGVVLVQLEMHVCRYIWDVLLEGYKNNTIKEVVDLFTAWPCNVSNSCPCWILNHQRRACPRSRTVQFPTPTFDIDRFNDVRQDPHIWQAQDRL